MHLRLAISSESAPPRCFMRFSAMEIILGTGCKCCGKMFDFFGGMTHFSRIGASGGGGGGGCDARAGTEGRDRERASERAKAGERGREKTPHESNDQNKS